MTNRWAKVMRYSTLENLSVSLHGASMMGAQYTELNSNITTAIDLALSSMLSSYSTRGTALPLLLPTLPSPAASTLHVVVEGEKEEDVAVKATIYFSGDPERDLTHLHLLTNALTRLGYPWHTQLSAKDKALVDLTTTLIKAVSDKPHTPRMQSITSKMTSFADNIRQGTNTIPTTTATDAEEVEKEVVRQYLDRLLIASLHLNPTKWGVQ